MKKALKFRHYFSWLVLFVQSVVLVEEMDSFCINFKDIFETKYKLDVNQVVNEYDAFLQHSLVTTSSFQDILDNKLNQRRRAFQLTIMLFYCLYLIPRYCFLCLLYFQDEKTRMHYQYILADYDEEMGILGRTFNVCWILYTVEILLNSLVMRKFEAEGSLEFLTDWLKRIPKKAEIKNGDEGEITAAGDLDNESRHKLISDLHYKMIFAKIMGRIATTGVQSFELIAFLLFIYKRRPSFFIVCLGLWNCIIVLIAAAIACSHLASLFLSYVVTADYFKVVIDNIIKKKWRT